MFNKIKEFIELIDSNYITILGYVTLLIILLILTFLIAPY